MGDASSFSERPRQNQNERQIGLLCAFASLQLGRCQKINLQISEEILCNPKKLLR